VSQPQGCVIHLCDPQLVQIIWQLDDDRLGSVCRSQTRRAQLVTTGLGLSAGARPVTPSFYRSSGDWMTTGLGLSAGARPMTPSLYRSSGDWMTTGLGLSAGARPVTPSLYRSSGDWMTTGLGLSAGARPGGHSLLMQWTLPSTVHALSTLT
jgi:hypothetical protein